MTRQTTNKIFMVRPQHFGYNEETADNNAFQQLSGGEDWSEISAKALNEFDAFVAKLRDYDIDVTVFEDQKDVKLPDAVFPNNWISTHADGTIVTYPMFAEARRAERREDILVALEEQFGFERRYSFEQFESKDMFLEGTGSMILDRTHRIVYACLGPRTDIQILDKFAVLLGYEKCIFHAFDDQDQAIYHTNVMMTLGEGYAMIGLDTIKDVGEREKVTGYLERTGKDIVALSMEQIHSFAGNALELVSSMGERFTIMSEQAFKSLKLEQIRIIEKHAPIIAAPLYTIEQYGGGSARCMIAEVFYPGA